MNNPIISVILSVYNAEQYLKEAIESILNQTYKDFEFIIIDDGSKDNSLNIIKYFQNNDNRILVISRENKGLIASLNEGINIASGKYIARMDADDISLPKRLEEQLRYMQEHEDVIVCGSFIELFGAENKIRKYPITDEEIRAFFVFRSPFAHPATMIQTEALKKVLYNKDYTHAEDYKLWMELLSYGKVYNIPKTLLKYRITAEQITSIYGEDSVIISKKIRREYIDDFYKSQNINFCIPKNITIEDIKKINIIEKKKIINSIKYVYYLSLDRYSFFSLVSFLISFDYFKYPYTVKEFLRVIYFHFKNQEKWL